MTFTPAPVQPNAIAKSDDVAAADVARGVADRLSPAEALGLAVELLAKYPALMRGFATWHDSLEFDNVGRLVVTVQLIAEPNFLDGARVTAPAASRV
jgi:hypothetical protein